MPTPFPSTFASYLFLGLFAILSFSSFSLVPVKRIPQQSKQGQRLAKKEQRLRLRLSQTKHSTQQKRLKKRLRNLEKRQRVAPFSLLSIFCFVAGMLAFFLMVSSAAAAGAMGGTVELAILIVLFTVLGLIALILGILYHNKRYRDPEANPQPAFATLGIILGSLSFLVGFIILLTALIDLG